MIKIHTVLTGSQLFSYLKRSDKYLSPPEGQKRTGWTFSPPPTLLNNKYQLDGEFLTGKSWLLEKKSKNWDELPNWYLPKAIEEAIKQKIQKQMILKLWDRGMKWSCQAKKLHLAWVI